MALTARASGAVGPSMWNVLARAQNLGQNLASNVKSALLDPDYEDDPEAEGGEQRRRAQQDDDGEQELVSGAAWIEGGQLEAGQGVTAQSLVC